MGIIFNDCECMENHYPEERYVRISYLAFFFGNLVIGLLIYIVYHGKEISKPFQQPLSAMFTLGFATVFFAYQVWRVPASPIYCFVPPKIRLCTLSRWDIPDWLAYAALLILAHIAFRRFNYSLLHELRPKTHMGKAKRSITHDDFHVIHVGHFEGFDIPKRLFVRKCTELSSFVEDLAYCCTASPVLIFIAYKRRIQNARTRIKNLLAGFDEMTQKGGKITDNGIQVGTLDFVLQRLNVARLITFAGDEVIDLLRKISSRPNSLTIDAKAVLVNAIQKKIDVKGTTKDLQEWVCDLFQSVEGRDLRLLKDGVDGSGEYHGLWKLIYRDITTSKLKNDLLRHFKANRHGAPATPVQGPARMLSRPPVGKYPTKVVSDIDDTLYSSGGDGFGLSGIDRRLPKKTVYPGLLKLYEELDATGIGDPTKCNLVFLSARPHVYKDITERVSFETFNQLVKQDDLHVMPTLIPGKCMTSFCAGWKVAQQKCCCADQNAWEGVGRQKAESLKELNDLYPGYHFIFFGDNGQGDYLAADLALGRDETIIKAFIHEVQAGTPGPVREMGRDEEKIEKNVIRYKTPVEAANKAFECEPKLLEIDAIGRICDAAIEDMDYIIGDMDKESPSAEKINAYAKDLIKQIEKSLVKLEQNQGRRDDSRLPLDEEDYKKLQVKLEGLKKNVDAAQTPTPTAALAPTDATPTTTITTSAPTEESTSKEAGAEKDAQTQAGEETKEEEEAEKKRQEEEAAKKRQEEEAEKTRLKAEAAEKKRIEKEEAERKRLEEEGEKKRKEEETAKRIEKAKLEAEAEERTRKAALEAKARAEKEAQAQAEEAKAALAAKARAEKEAQARAEEAKAKTEISAKPKQPAPKAAAPKQPAKKEEAEASEDEESIDFDLYGT